MSRVKDQKIKRLNKLSVAPAIIGLIVAAFAFLGLTGAIAVFLLSSTVTNKVAAANETAGKNAEMIYDYLHKFDSQDELQNELFDKHFEGDGVVAVAIANKDGKFIYIQGSRYPSKDSIHRVRIGKNSFYLGIESTDGFLNIDDGEVDVDFAKILSEQGKIDNEFLRNMLESPKWAEGNALETHLWFGFRDDPDYDVYIMSLVTVTRFEFLSVVIAFASSLILFLLFCVYQMIAIIRTITQRRRIFKVMSTDIVTGGNNWFYFTRMGSKNKYYRSRRPYIFVSLGLEKFSNYSLCNGEVKGEELLEEIYVILTNNIRRVELMCRKEAAEFALLLVKEDPMVLSGRMISIVSQIGIKHPDLVTRFRVGFCEAGLSRDRSVADIYADANLARLSVVSAPDYAEAWFDDKMKEEQLWIQTVENEMEAALKNREFVMYLQPKFSTSTEKVGGAEALCRWKKPDVGLVPPGKFIPLFEQNGFIIKLDDFMIAEVAKAQAKWMSEGKKLFPISVNVSRAHFTQENLAEHIRDIVDTYGVPHKYVELELTESAFFDDKDILLNTVAKLKEYGFPISMDDFGAGYSSLNSLKEMPLDVVKLDAEFFRGNDDNLEKAYLIVSQTITLAKRLSMHVVAEGIETREQVDYLAGEECDLIQGFYFAKPMPVEDFEKIAYAPS